MPYIQRQYTDYLAHAQTCNECKYESCELIECDYCSKMYCIDCQYLQLTPLADQRLLRNIRFCRDCFALEFIEVSRDVIYWPMLDIRAWESKRLTKEKIRTKTLEFRLMMDESEFELSQLTISDLQIN